MGGSGKALVYSFCSFIKLLWEFYNAVHLDLPNFSVLTSTTRLDIAQRNIHTVALTLIAIHNVLWPAE